MGTATTFDRASMRFSWRGAGVAIALVAYFYIVVRFLLDSTGQLERHGNKLPLYWLHIVGGTIVLALGPFQFIAPIRNRFRRYHRLAGYGFVTGSLMAFAGFVAIQPQWSVGLG